MRMAPFDFQVLDWQNISRESHAGETGVAYWQTFFVNDIRVRKVEYSPGYRADHWCEKGHVILCLEGVLTTELADGRFMTLSPGMTYFVGDHSQAHRSVSEQGCKLFIVD
ncbi:MAG TPA: DHCW motif cupin fold protein [Chitinophagaceae bacterium]|nr:DHCW motif cupin fold protein [Chitinophagaceae bacterium]